jgi:hypothetical protein
MIGLITLLICLIVVIYLFKVLIRVIKGGGPASFIEYGEEYMNTIIPKKNLSKKEQLENQGTLFKAINNSLEDVPIDEYPLKLIEFVKGMGKSLLEIVKSWRVIQLRKLTNKENLTGGLQYLSSDNHLSVFLNNLPTVLYTEVTNTFPPKAKKVLEPVLNKLFSSLNNFFKQEQFTMNGGNDVSEEESEEQLEDLEQPEEYEEEYEEDEECSDNVNYDDLEDEDRELVEDEELAPYHSEQEDVF